MISRTEVLINNVLDTLFDIQEGVKKAEAIGLDYTEFNLHRTALIESTCQQVEVNLNLTNEEINFSLSLVERALKDLNLLLVRENDVPTKVIKAQ